MAAIQFGQFTLFLLGITFILICAYLCQIFNIYKYWKRKNVPYVKPTLIFGNFTDLVLGRMNLSEQLKVLYNEYDHPYIGIYIFDTPYLLLKDPEIIKQILVKDFHIFTDRKVSANEDVDPIAFYTLLSAGGATWKAIRTKLSPVFTSGKMKLMMPLVETCCEDLVDLLNSSVETTVDVKEVMSKFTIDVISLCAFGLNSNCLKDEDSLIGRMAKQMIDPNSLMRTVSIGCFFFIPFLTNLFRLTFVEKKSQSFFINLFKETMEKRRKEKIVKNDFVDILNSLQNEDGGFQFDDVKLGAQTISFFIAGNHTTSTILSFLINEITLQPNIQDRMREEIDGITDQFGKTSYESLQNLRYTDMVIKETLRKYPLAPLLTRKANRRYTFETTGLEIEKNVPVLISISGLHYDPKYFPEPNKFDPERFSPENKNNLVPYTYLPFGEGPRFCIGERFALMVMKIALVSMLKNFVFVKCDKTRDPIEINNVSAFLQPKNGVPVKLIKRIQ